MGCWCLCQVTPQSHPRGYTDTHASPCGHTLAHCCHGDNRGKCLMKTLMRIYGAVALCIYRDMTLSPSRAASCGSTSISSLIQVVADHRGICSGRRPQYAAGPPAPAQAATRGFGCPINVIKRDQKCALFSFDLN